VSRGGQGGGGPRPQGGGPRSQGPKAAGPKPQGGAPKQPPKPAPPKSYLWVGVDDPAKRLLPHEAFLTLELDPARGAVLDLYVERGGNEFTGLAVQAIRVPGLKARAQLAGAEIIDPPPTVVGLGSLGGPLASCGGGGASPKGLSPLRRLGGDASAAPAPTGSQESAASDAAPDDFDEAAESAAPDDDPALGDIESYRRRRAEEGAREADDADLTDPELDDEAIDEAETDAASERVLIFPGQGYEVESIRLKVVALAGDRIELDVSGRCAEIGDDGEAAPESTPFGGKLYARLEEA